MESVYLYIIQHVDLCGTNVCIAQVHVHVYINMYMCMFMFTCISIHQRLGNDKLCIHIITCIYAFSLYTVETALVSVLKR